MLTNNCKKVAMIEIQIRIRSKKKSKNYFLRFYDWTTSYFEFNLFLLTKTMLKNLTRVCRIRFPSQFWHTSANNVSLIALEIWKSTNFSWLILLMNMQNEMKLKIANLLSPKIYRYVKVALVHLLLPKIN